VSVLKLMAVDECTSVFRMIIVVKGQIPQVQGRKEGARTRYTGMDVLAASLPPRSMAGHQRSVLVRSCRR
jgi:para-aminobenzoate synthetase